MIGAHNIVESIRQTRFLIQVLNSRQLETSDRKARRAADKTSLWLLVVVLQLGELEYNLVSFSTLSPDELFMEYMRRKVRVKRVVSFYLLMQEKGCCLIALAVDRRGVCCTAFCSIENSNPRRTRYPFWRRRNQMCLEFDKYKCLSNTAFGVGSNPGGGWKDGGSAVPALLSMLHLMILYYGVRHQGQGLCNRLKDGRDWLKKGHVEASHLNKGIRIVIKLNFHGVKAAQ